MRARTSVYSAHAHTFPSADGCERRRLQRRGTTPREGPRAVAVELQRELPQQPAELGRTPFCLCRRRDAALASMATRLSEVWTPARAVAAANRALAAGVRRRRASKRFFRSRKRSLATDADGGRSRILFSTPSAALYWASCNAAHSAFRRTTSRDAAPRTTLKASFSAESGSS